MSTDTTKMAPLAASEMPTSTATPSTQEGSASESTSNWTKYTTQVPTAPPAEQETSTTTTTTNKKTSSTAYSFAGSALGTESTDNLNSKETKKNESETKTSNNDEEKHEDSIFECNICLDTAKDAVVSMCGHLFCWPCLHQWLETRPNRKLCPVCKAAIGKDKVIPLYGRNSTKQEDPRNKVPPRPAGQRTEPEPQQGFQGFGLGDGFHMSFGIGAFPFGYFASSFNFGEPRPAAANRGTTQYEDEQQLSKLFLYLAFLCIAWLVFA